METIATISFIVLIIVIIVAAYYGFKNKQDEENINN